MVCIIKPSLHLLSIPGYLDDGLEWISVLQGLRSLMTPLDWGFTAVGVVGAVMVFWPDKAKDVSKPARPLGKSSSEQYVSPDHSGTVTFDYSNNDGKYRIGEGEHKFVTRWGPCGEDSMYLYRGGDHSSVALTDKPAIEEIKDASSYNRSSRYRQVGVGQVAVICNGHHRWAAVKIIDIEKDKKKLTFQYAIQTDGTSGLAP